MSEIPEEYIRKIIHIDMDAFYASVEQRDNPHLKGKPVAVGGSKERGVVAAASYEARTFGIRSAMPSALAWRRCPDLIFVKPDFTKYKAVSDQIREIFFEFTDLVEPLSLDEAYLDVTLSHSEIPTATRIAKEIRKRILQETGLTSSAGISINKFLAKIASDINKPNGQKTIMPADVISFLEELPIQKFFGIGEKTAEKMHHLGIHKGADLKEWDQALLVREFGKSGVHYYQIVRGIQKSRVKPDRIRKSVGAERTFETDLSGIDVVEKELQRINEILTDRLKKVGTRGKTLTLKVRFHDFEQHTYSTTFSQHTDHSDIILEQAMSLLHKNIPEKPVRLLGLSISNLEQGGNKTPMQLTLDF